MKETRELIEAFKQKMAEIEDIKKDEEVQIFR